MRTIVAFLLIAFVCAAQSPNDIEKLEKKVSEHPDSVPDRMALLDRLTDRSVSLPAEQVREARRRHVLWLIEHHPEATIFSRPSVLIPTRGRLADPSGAAEVVVLWKEVAARPGAKPEVIANAATYLRGVDIPAALAILGAHPEDPVLSHARGFVDAASVVGLSGLSQNSSRFGSSASLRSNPEAKAARQEIDSSANPHLIGGAGVALVQTTPLTELPSDLVFGDDDIFTLAERWLRRAIEIGPPSLEWKTALGQDLSFRAGRAVDPQEKVRLFRESISLVADPAKPDIRSNLIVAEFDAGDDAAAEHDALDLLKSASIRPNTYHVAQTIVGRVAAAKGDLKEAKARLIASITMPNTFKNASFQPNMTLAQDVYDSGDHDAVLEFLEASRTVWKSDRGRIDRMIRFVKKAPSVDLVQLSRELPGNGMLRHSAPAFDGTDLNGKNWTREAVNGKVVALEFGPALPLVEKVSEDYAARGVVLLQIHDEETKRRFEILTDPTLVVLDRQGNVMTFRSGPATEAELRSDFEMGFGAASTPGSLPAPKQSESANGDHGKIALAWEPVENAESYVVEWDSRGEKGWIFDQEKTVRVIPSHEPSAEIDLTGFTRIRWRVYAVPKSGPAGKISAWREIDGVPVTKIYK